MLNRKLLWSAYLALKLYHRRPSSDLAIKDSLIAWCVDDCVLWFGLKIENLLNERVEIGEGKDKRYEAKYELNDLLDPSFRIERPMPKAKQLPLQGGSPQGAALLAMAASQSNLVVKRWRAIPPS